MFLAPITWIVLFCVSVVIPRCPTQELDAITQEATQLASKLDSLITVITTATNMSQEETLNTQLEVVDADAAYLRAVLEKALVYAVTYKDGLEGGYAETCWG